MATATAVLPGIRLDLIELDWRGLDEIELDWIVEIERVNDTIIVLNHSCRKCNINLPDCSMRSIVAMLVSVK
jgi:hypothetical protein